MDELLERLAADGKLEMGNVVGAISGDCFVVVNCRGLCWNGSAWVRSWSNAIQFRRPDAAYELCEEAAAEADRVTGVAGMVCYIPPGTSASLVLSAFLDLS